MEEKKDIEIKGYYQRKYDKEEFIYYKEDGKEYLTNGKFPFNANETILKAMNPIQEVDLKKIQEEMKGNEQFERLSEKLSKQSEVLKQEQVKEPEVQEKVESQETSLEDAKEDKEGLENLEKSESEKAISEEKLEVFTNKLNTMYQEFQENMVSTMREFAKENFMEINEKAFKEQFNAVDFGNVLKSAIKIQEQERPEEIKKEQAKEKSEIQNEEEPTKGITKRVNENIQSCQGKIKETLGYIHNYSVQNSIYTKAGQENLYRELNSALQQVEGAMNRIGKIVQEMTPNEIKINKIEKSAETFANMSFDLYQSHGNFECSMAYIKEYAKQEGMSLSNDILKTGNLKEKFETHSVKGVQDVFVQAINVGDRQHLSEVIKEGGHKPNNHLIDAVKNVNQHFGKDHTIKEIQAMFQNRSTLPEQDKNVVTNAGKAFQQEESLLKKFREMLPSS